MRRCPAAGMKEDKENARPKERRGAAAGPGALLGAGTATGTDGRAGGAELDRLERPKDKKETLSKVGPARCSGWGPPARGNGASRRGPQGGGAGGTATLTVPPAAGGDPPAAAQPDKGAAGGAPAAPARARLLRVLRQRLQVRPPGRPGGSPRAAAATADRAREVLPPCHPCSRSCVSAACTRTCSPEPTSTSKTRKT